MKLPLFLVILFVTNILGAQKNEVIKWIDLNAISLEKNDSENYLKLTSDYLNPYFTTAEIFGFGEATHHNKEFFEVKTEFFKYLVLHQNVRIFVLEESFGACYYINQYLKGKNGNVRELVLNFRQRIWRTEEMIALISWMKSYNEGKPSNQQIEFYGNDCMFNYELTTIVKNELQKQNIPISQDEIDVLDVYAQQYDDYFSKDKSARIYTKINELKQILSKLKTANTGEEESSFAIEAFDYFTEFLNNPTQETRDFYMAQTIERLYTISQKKIFIWAHNDHIKKTFVYRDHTPSMGNWLDKKFKNKYYAVGLEFGIGELFGYNPEKKRGENSTLDKPIKNTNGEFLFSTQHDAFFVDFDSASKNEIMKNFLSQKRDYIMIGGQGFTLKYVNYYYVTEKYNAMYNGLIYIKKISRNSPIQ